MIEPRDNIRRGGKKWFKTKVQYPEYVEDGDEMKKKVRIIENVFHVRNSAEAREQLVKRLHTKCDIPEVIAHFMANDQNLDIQVISEEQASGHFHTIGFQDGYDDDPCACCEKRPSCPYECFEQAGSNCPQY